MRAAPSPIELSAAVVLSTSPKRPVYIEPAPTRSNATPMTARHTEARRSGRMASCRMAATGGTREAWRAGASADSTVTTMPTRRAITTVRGWITNPPPGRAIPNESRAARSAMASPAPTATPISEATAPMIRASTSTARTTWLRVEPMARISASSRARWAMTIWKVL